jgi:hypothetical protein
MLQMSAFPAAYVLLLSRLWQELESMLTLQSLPLEGASSARVEVGLEIFRLELHLLQDLLEGSRLQVDLHQRARVQRTIDRLLAALGPAAACSALSVEAAQNLLFDEVRSLLLPDPPCRNPPVNKRTPGRYTPFLPDFKMSHRTEDGQREAVHH